VLNSEIVRECRCGSAFASEVAPQVLKTSDIMTSSGGAAVELKNAPHEDAAKAAWHSEKVK